MIKFIKKPIVLLCLFFIAIAGTICLRIYVEETSYISPDSHFYIRVAQNIVNGKGIVAPIVYPFDKFTEEKPLCMWPAGYPLLIAGMAKFIDNVMIASKVTNILFIGLCLLLFYLSYKWKGIIMGLIFCFYGVLEVFSYTWSEGAFIFGLLVLWQLIVYQYHNKITSKYFILGVGFTLSYLFAIRYVGIVYIGFIFLLGTYYGYKNNRKKMWEVWTSLLLPTCFIAAYLYYNYTNSGLISGSDRFFPFAEPLDDFLIGLAQGLVNEFTIARNYYFRNYSDYLYLSLLLIQLTVTTYIILVFKKEQVKWTWSVDSKTLLIMSFFYLISIVILRKLSPFDPFNYRILAPFSFLFWVAILKELAAHEKLWKKIKCPIIGFLLLSLIMNLPKVYLLSLLT